MSAYDYDVVMLVLNDVSFDGRVRNEAAALVGAGWRVLVIGTQRSDGTLPDRESWNGVNLWRVRYRRFGGLVAALALDSSWVAGMADFPYPGLDSARVYHAHDLPALILLSLARVGWRKRPALVYDSHELYLFQPRYTSCLAVWWHQFTLPLSMALEGYLARRANGVLALVDGRARLLSRWYKIPRPLVIHNALNPVDEHAPAPVDLQAVIGPGRRCIIHTGNIIERWLAIPELVRAVALLPDDVALVFLGQGESAGNVRALASQLGISERVFIVPPVPPEQVTAVIRSADVAAILLRPESWNIRAALPNKLFEAISAGVPVLASDIFVLRRIVRRHELGLCCDFDDPEAIAAALRQMLTPEAQSHYRARVRAARLEINQQVEMQKLLNFYRTLLP